MSKFVTKQLQIGLVGYGYNQLSCDSGSGALLGCFESRVVGAGPQIGYILPLGEMQAYFNLKGYKEFDSAHRPRGWNTWLTISISPAIDGAAGIHPPGKEIGAAEQRLRRFALVVPIPRFANPYGTR